MTFDRESLACAAGFYDGEGSSGCLSHGKGRKPQLQLTIGQTDPEVLIKFQKAVGGLGKLIGPYSYKNPKWHPVWFFRTNKKDEFITIMSALWGWLGTRKKAQFTQAMLVFRGDV